VTPDLESALEAIKERVEADLGDRDVRYVEMVDRASKWLERIGRGWCVASTGPVGFIGGVTMLWVGKQLQATEIGHAALHGAYDRFADAEKFHAHHFAWRMPIDEELWADLHAAKHAGRKALAGSKLSIVGKLARKALPYYGREYFMMPALAGPLWWKALLGNALSEIMRDAFTYAVLRYGHDAETNIRLPKPLSILAGGLDLRIEHRLFPQLPPHRLREIAPEVKRAFEAHGVPYRVEGIRALLKRVA
jgi:hypothetical protein